MKTLLTCVVLLLATLYCDASCPNIVSRQSWGARSNRPSQSLSQNPAPFVVIHHSDTPPCPTQANCKTRVKNIQEYHIDHNRWDDIGYNFLVGGDGNVYEGRGWDKSGAHLPNYNSKSIGITLIGNFQDQKPPALQLNAVKALIDCGRSSGKISGSYRLIGHRQGKSTTCPGNALYNEIKTWSNFDNTLAPRV